MIRIPSFRSALTLVASVTLTFVTFQQTATISIESAATTAVIHPGVA